MDVFGSMISIVEERLFELEGESYLLRVKHGKNKMKIIRMTQWDIKT